jgi:ArsR family transcriptional regulator
MLDLTRFDRAVFEASASRAAALLRLLANERRLMVLCQLADGGELPVSELQRRVGISQSALSQHLAMLREDGVLATRREGQTIHYRIADPAALKVMATLAEIYCPPDPESSQCP